MMAAHGEMAGGHGGNGDGLLVPGPNAQTEGVSGRITVRRQAVAPLLEPGKGLLISGAVIESPKRPTVVVGQRSNGKSRLEAVRR